MKPFTKEHKELFNRCYPELNFEEYKYAFIIFTLQKIPTGLNQSDNNEVYEKPWGDTPGPVG
jgi:hypothetical protein